MMHPEQSQNFNERLNQWVASQGFWFQVRYSMAGSGMKGQAMFHLLRMGFRFLVFAAIVAIGVLVYLEKRTDSKFFTESLKESIQEGLGAGEAEMGKFERLQGKLEINRFAAEGGDHTFFETLEARNIRCSMGLLDGLASIWKPGIISISRLDLEFRAGTDDAESARKFAETLFREFKNVEVNSIEVADATVRWGYSERTRGSIEGSVLKIQRTGDGWRMIFKGGTFHQNWLNNLDIVNLVVTCNPEGLVFEKAEMKDNGGTVDFSGLRIIGGERPEVKGVVKIQNLNLENILAPAMTTFVEGTISGDLRAFGSTNSSDGIGFEGDIVLDGKDVLILRKRLPLLEALSVVDGTRNYHRIDFREGSFHIKSQAGGMLVTDVDLQAEDLFTMDGQLKVRLPTQQEINEAVAQGSGMEASPFFSGDEGLARLGASGKENSFSLKNAAKARAKKGDEAMSLSERLDHSLELRRLTSQAAERMSRMLQYEGAFRITIPGDAFENAGRLEQSYPVDPATGRIPLMVPIEGNLYELTLKQAENLYQQRGEK